MSPHERASLDIEHFGNHRPSALRLAEIVSLATRIEPALLRKARLALAPDVDAGAEADLWFSPLVESWSAEACMLRPEVAEILRQRLLKNRSRAEHARRVVEEVHRRSPPVLVSEEKVTWLALFGGDSALDEIEEELQKILRTMVSDETLGVAVARWALRALPRFPPLVREVPAARLLAFGVAARLGANPLFQEANSLQIPKDVEWVIPESARSHQQTIRLMLSEGALVFLNPDDSERGFELNLPSTQPLLLEISWRARGREHRDVIIPEPGRSVGFPSYTQRVRLRTVTGDRFELTLFPFKGKEFDSTIPYPLEKNRGAAFVGVTLLGAGFLLSREESQELIREDQRYREVLKPYLNGHQLYSNPDQSANRFAIDFRDWPLDRESAPPEYRGPVASDYPKCLEIVRKRVKPVRDRLSTLGMKRRWWQWAYRRSELQTALSRVSRAFACSRVGKYPLFHPLEPSVVPADSLVIVLDPRWATFAVLQSELHASWVRAWGGRMGSSWRYGVHDCFETFPFPERTFMLEDLGAQLFEVRNTALQDHRVGLTALYNKVHDPEERSPLLDGLRDTMTKVDSTVVASYGWGDMQLAHGFHETEDGTRFTISESARREILGRLLELNRKIHFTHPGAGKGPASKRRGSSKR